MRIRYKASDRTGIISRGLVDAKSTQEAVEYLRQKELMPISVDRIDNKFWTDLPFFSSKIKSNDLILFTRQLSSMLSSGLTLIRALELLKAEIKNQAFVEVITTVTNDIQEGKTMTQALAKHPKVFNQIYISIISAGEQSGLLDKVLLRLTENMEKQAKLKSTITSALMYPAIVIIMMFGVMLVMSFFVIPQLSNLFTSMNVPIPLPTQIVIGVSKFMVSFWPFIFAVGAALMFAYRRWVATPNGRLIMDTLVLKLPVFGKLISQTILAEFSRTFGLLVGTGTLVVQALIEAADTTGNVLFKTAIVDVSRMVEKGQPIGDSMSSYVLFPPMLIQLIKIGEQTGKIDESLLRASEYFETEVDHAVKNLTTAMEPFIMIILGGGVAFLLFSVLTPIYSLITSIQ
jgi:type IV pilus assembly protein PilC